MIIYLEKISISVEPKTKISISSSDILEISVTKTCLDILQDLGTAFSEAIRPEGLHKPDIIAPYIIENDTGFEITLNLKRGSLNLHSSHFPTNDIDAIAMLSSGVIFQNPSSNVLDKEFDSNSITTCRISAGGKAYLQAKTDDTIATISAFSSLNKETHLKDMFLFVQVCFF